MSSLVDVLKRFLIDHVSEFNKTDKAVLTSVLLKIKEKKFELALELFEAHLAFLKDYFEQSSEIMAKIREKIPDLPPVDPFAAAALAAFGKDDELEFGDSDDEVTANYKQHVVPESTVVATPRPKRQLSDQPKPAKKKRAVATNDGGAAKSSTKKPRKKSAYNMFTAGGGKRKDWQFADKLFYQDLADEVNNGKSVPTIIKPVSAKTVTKPMPIEEESKVETVAQESKKAEPSPEPTKTPPSVLELPGEDSSDANEPPHSVPELPGEDSSDDEAEPSPEPAETPPSVPEFPGEDSSDDDEYVEEEDRDRNNTPYLNVRDALKVTLSAEATALVAQVSALRGQTKEFNTANKIAAFLRKTAVHVEEESKEDVHYSPEEANQFYVVSEVDVDDDGVLEEIELGLHKDGTEDEYKFKHKMTIPVRFIHWEIISRADQTVEVTKGDEDDRWRAVLDCLHTYGDEGHPFGVPLVDADGAPLLDDRGQQRYNDIDNIDAIEGEEGVKGVSALVKEAANVARKVYTDKLKQMGHTWKAKRGTDGFIGEVDLHVFDAPEELEPLRQSWLNKLSLSNGPTNKPDAVNYVFDPGWKPPVGTRTEEEKDKDADQIHIRTWALRVGMHQLPAIAYKIKNNQPKIEYDDNDEDKEHPIRAVASAGRRILVQWDDEEYEAIVIANDPNADPPLLRCEYTSPSVQVGQWMMTKVRHGNDFRYVVEGPESAGEAKEGNFQLGQPETFERVRDFFVAHGIDNVPIISTDEGAVWGPFDLNFEEDTFKKMELYDGKDRDASNRKEDAATAAVEAAASAAIHRQAVREAQTGDVPEGDDPYLTNVVLFDGREYDVRKRKFEGGTYFYWIDNEWVAQQKLAIKPPEEIEFEEDHGGGGNNAREEDVYEEEDVDADTIYIYTDEEGKQYRVKIVGEPYQKMKDGKLDLDWYWDKRNEAERARLRADAIKVARAKNNEIIIGEYEIRRARLVIGGRKVEGGYTVFKDDSKVVTRHDMASLLHWLAENGLVIDDNEDIDAIGSLWDISEEYIDEYIEKYKDESGNVKQKHDFANSYSEFVDVVDDAGHRFPGVEQANLIRASEAEAEAAAAATAQAAEEAIVAQEDAKNADVVSSSNDSETDDSSDEEEDK